MRTRVCVVDNRVFLLGLDELYRERMKAHEREELLRCARAVCGSLNVPSHDGPVEGYYSEDELLTEYFLRMRALQEVHGNKRPLVDELPEFRRLLDVTSAPLFGQPFFDGKLLPTGKDPLSKALEASFPNWTIDALVSAAFAQANASDDFSLVGLAALAKDSLVLAALRETAVLYAYVAVGCAPERVAVSYEWRVEPVLAERAQRFVGVFNQLFREDLPVPVPENAELFWNAADEEKVYGRCVRLGYDNSTRPFRNYHWAVAGGSGGLGVRDFWSTELWTTERFRQALSDGETLPFEN